MTHEQNINALGIWIFLLIAYLLRKTSFGFIWKFLRMFFIILFVTLGTNYAKKEIKEWWNK
jgi:hypothetical protein